MNIDTIYRQHHIMPNLREHQFRVAGVAYLIAQARPELTRDLPNIILAGLLHDMGNIIKFDLSRFPEFLKPEGFAYWKKVQDGMIARYGEDEHVATVEIAQEIVGDRTLTAPHIDATRTLELIDAVGFSHARENALCTDIGKKIVAYADMRVAPVGVCSLDERLEDGRKRFRMRKKAPYDQGFFDEMVSFLMKIETQIFEAIALTPEDITEESVQKIVPDMLSLLAVRS